jgi:hypothetical protein
VVCVVVSSGIVALGDVKEAIGYHQVFGDILRGMEMIIKKKQGRCDCIKMPEAGIASSFPKKLQRMCKVREACLNSVGCGESILMMGCVCDTVLLVQ